MAQMGFYFDATRCHSCKTCVIACKDKNNAGVGLNIRRVYDYESGVYPTPQLHHYSISCNHCDKPACVEKCPTGSMYKRAEDGIVLLDQGSCAACLDCLEVCPYGALQHDPKTGRLAKCDTCMDLWSRGEKPACVASCPMKALDFGVIDELRLKYSNFDQTNSSVATSVGDSDTINARSLKVTLVTDAPFLPDSKLARPNLLIRLV